MSAICAASTASAMRRFPSGDPDLADGDLRGAQAEGALEDENRKLKKPLAETMLDASTLKDARKNF